MKSRLRVLALALVLGSSGFAWADGSEEQMADDCVLIILEDGTQVLACGAEEIESVRSRGSGGRF